MPLWADRPAPVPAPAPAAPPERSEWQKRMDRREQDEIDQLAYFAKTQDAAPSPER